MEAVEAPGIGNEAAALLLEHLPDRAAVLFGVPVHLGVGDAFVGQPAVQVLQCLEAQTRREEAFSYQPDLILDLAAPFPDFMVKRAKKMVLDVALENLRERVMRPASQ